MKAILLTAALVFSLAASAAASPPIPPAITLAPAVTLGPRKPPVTPRPTYPALAGARLIPHILFIPVITR